MASSHPAPAGACTHELRALLGPRALVQQEHQLLAVPLHRAVARLGTFCPARGGWALAAALALHDLAAVRDDGLCGQPAAQLGQRRSLADQAIWQQATDDGGRWVVGYAGRFWRPDRRLAQPDWPGFVGWRAPGTARVAWQFSLGCPDPARPALSRLSFSMVAAGVDLRGHAALRAYLLTVGWASRRLRRQLCRAAAQHCHNP